jgi:ferritin
VFPHWLIGVSLIALVAWIAQTFFQLILLPIIMVGQNVIQGQQDAKAESDHKTLTYLANLQEEQMKELKNQGEILDFLRSKFKNEK